MYEAVFIAATGLRHQQARMDVIANNVANVNSAAYKTARLDFKDALHTTGVIPGLPRTRDSEGGNQQKGHGVMIAQIMKDPRTGSMQATGRELDIAIEGEGYLALRDLFGETVYTRNGSLHLDDDQWLVSGDGYFIYDVNGQPIQAPPQTTNINIDQFGNITFFAIGQEATYSLGFYTFRNVSGLESAGYGNYRESVSSGDRRTADVVIRQGVLEMSNVGLADEMTSMIRTQRALQLCARALKTADEMEGQANNMKR